jgi:hypothetical protein
VTLTAADWQTRALWDVGLGLPGGPDQDPDEAQAVAALRGQVGTLWDMAATEPGVAAGGAGLQYLYTRRALIRALLGQARGSVDAWLGRVFRYQASQRFRNLLQLLQDTEKEIATAVLAARAARAPLTAPILATAPYQVGGYRHAPAQGEPVNPGTCGPDPNDPRYAGDLRRRPYYGD